MCQLVLALLLGAGTPHAFVKFGGQCISMLFCCVYRCVVVVGGLRSALHSALGGRLQPDVSGAFPLQQRHRRAQTERLRCCLHRAVR